MKIMFEDIIKGRRSISQFEERLVDLTIIDECIALAGYAPSSCNTQPWYFLVFSSENSKERLMDYIERGYQYTSDGLGANRILVPLLRRLLDFFSRYGKFDKAPVYVLLFARPYDTPLFSQAIKISKQNKIEKIAQDSVITSTAMAMQNFLLALHHKGLGGRVKDGIKFFMNFDELRDSFYKEFNIPKDFQSVSGIQIGYPLEKGLTVKVKNKLPLEKIRRHI